MKSFPRVGETVRTGAYETNVHSEGKGSPVLLLHGSGPGMSAWANWSAALSELSARHLVLAPDLVGFGHTARPADLVCGIEVWVQQAISLLDAFGIEQTDVVGDSFGSAIALAMAIRAPHRVRRLVLMGPMGVPFRITPALEAIWGYEPSPAAMRSLLDLCMSEGSGLKDEIAQFRYETSVLPGLHEAYKAMFPAPRQRWVDSSVSAEADIRALPHQALIIHGSEDQVIPLSNARTLAGWIPNARLEILEHCGHWVQFERPREFTRVLCEFVDDEIDS